MSGFPTAWNLITSSCAVTDFFRYWMTFCGHMMNLLEKLLLVWLIYSRDLFVVKCFWFFLVVEVVVVPHVPLLQFYCIIFIFGGSLLIAIKCQISERFSAFRVFSRLQKFSLTQKIKQIFRWLPFNSYKNCERF